MQRHEWRLMPGLSRLQDDIGRRVFLWGHVPLFFALALIAWSGPNSVAATCLSAFAVLHVGLHVLYRNHPSNEFRNPVSQAFIWAAGAFGMLHLTLT